MNKAAIITGASAGIGHATAGHLIAAGYRVINLSRRLADIDGVDTIAVDLSQPLDAAVVDRLTNHVANADQSTVIHCAGLLGSDHATSVQRSALEHSLAVNVTAPAMLNQHLIPSLTPGSSIIFVGSTLGDKAVQGAFGYVTSKHAVNGMMRATCQDLTGTGVHTAVVSPGFTDTEMLRDHVGNDAGILSSLAENVTMGRLIEPDEIARTIMFCVDNPVINGSVIHANLGQIER
ncbi:MAG: SDR family oxidoreductase [Pseudomonadota bacterium]